MKNQSTDTLFKFHLIMCVMLWLKGQLTQNLLTNFTLLPVSYSSKDFLCVSFSVIYIEKRNITTLIKTQIR